MIRHIFIICICLGIFKSTNSQDILGIRGYYNFNNCDGTDNSGRNPAATFVNGSTCGCGSSGTALQLDGVDDQVVFTGADVQNAFRLQEFTISFYFRPFQGSGTMDLLSKRENCNNVKAFAVRYSPASRLLDVTLSEDNSNIGSVQARLDQNKCWNHVVIIRDRNVTKLYLNGFKVKETVASKRLNIDNRAPVVVAGSPCLGATDKPFRGWFDEFRIYERALSESEILRLSNSIDKIKTLDTTIYLGTSVNTFISKSCANSYEWTPSTSVLDPNSGQTIISPVSSSDYVLKFSQDGCIASDTLKIKVVDPNTLGCEEVFLPNAFTPNGDFRNDKYFISNGIILRNFISFEIFDRSGSRIFNAENALDGWDGTINGTPANPGTFVYKVSYKCNDQELAKTGSFVLLR
jgi:gliding motility-associated-like protein